MYIYKDYTEYYGRVMQFGKNKKVPIHRWYPFVEGYSRDFIKSIIDEQEIKPESCLEPFSGSGTTALELQMMGIKCYSFEVNPFMYTLSKAKLLSSDYRIGTIKKHLERMLDFVSGLNDTDIDLESVFVTLVENQSTEKWNLNKEVYLAVEKLILAVRSLNSIKYSHLYMIVIANALLEYGNLYRNGKCLSYKKNWEKKKYQQEDVVSYFIDFINNILLIDIAGNDNEKRCCNERYLFLGDSRDLISRKIENDSIELVITSPPYLNSRDYTDSYMLELRALKYLNNYQEIKELRKKTLRSHVQLKLENDFRIENLILNHTISKLNKACVKKESWNEEIVLMVKAYFDDMHGIFQTMHRKLKKGKRVYFNVSNSAYYGVLIDTLEICSSIAEEIGFNVIEIRKARYLSPSPQQREEIDDLLEGVIVLEK